MALSSRFWRWFGRCPDEEWLAAYVDGQLLGRDKQRLQSHLSKCAPCRDAVGFLVRAARNAAPTQVPGDYLAAAVNVAPAPPRRPALAWTAAAGVTAMVVIAGGVLLMRSGQVLQTQPTPSTPKPPAVAMLEKPAIAPLSPAPDRPNVLRGLHSRTLQLISPSAPNATLTTPNLRFAWKAVASAGSYAIRVTSETGEPLWEAHVETNHATLPASVHLASGAKYFVWVRADLADGSTVESDAVPFIAGAAR